MSSIFYKLDGHRRYSRNKPGRRSKAARWTPDVSGSQKQSLQQPPDQRSILHCTIIRQHDETRAWEHQNSSVNLIYANLVT